MLLLSSSLLPVAPVTLTRSLPAKSTRFSLPTFTSLELELSSYCILPMLIYSTMMMNTAWDLLLTSFILVEADALACEPLIMRLYISAGDLTAHSESPSTKTPRLASSCIYKRVLSVLSRSDMTSLYIYK